MQSYKTYLRCLLAVDSVVLVEAVVTLKNGGKVHYVYEKNLPEDVKEGECSYKVVKMPSHFLPVAGILKMGKILLQF